MVIVLKITANADKPDIVVYAWGNYNGKLFYKFMTAQRGFKQVDSVTGKFKLLQFSSRDYLFMYKSSFLIYTSDNNSFFLKKLSEIKTDVRKYDFFLKIKDLPLSTAGKSSPKMKMLSSLGIKEIFLGVKNDIVLNLKFNNSRSSQMLAGMLKGILASQTIAAQNAIKLLKEKATNQFEKEYSLPIVFKESFVSMLGDIKSKLSLSSSGNMLVARLPLKSVPFFSSKSIYLLIPAMAAIAVPNFIKARNEARRKNCMANMKLLENAIQMYEMDGNKIKASVDIDNLQAILVKQGYIQKAVKCPAGGKYILYRKKDGNSYYWAVRCSKHGILKWK